jgi:hypothetical protein
MSIPEKSCKNFDSINLIQRCVEIKKKKSDSFYEADPDPKVDPDPRINVDLKEEIQTWNTAKFKNISLVTDVID